MHPASICLPTERATVSTNKTLAFPKTHRVGFVLELRPGYARGGMAGTTPGSELLFLEIPSTFDTKMSLVSVSNSLQITWLASSFCSWCTMPLKPSRACGTRWLKGAAGCPPFLVPGWWPPPFEELVVHASQSTLCFWFGLDPSTVTRP